MKNIEEMKKQKKVKQDSTGSEKMTNQRKNEINRKKLKKGSKNEKIQNKWNWIFAIFTLQVFKNFHIS